MEEKKSNVVEMIPRTKKQDKPEKMSYEQLEQVAHQLSEQVRQLYSQLQKSNLNNMFKRLDYLFKVVENGHIFDQDFTNKCIDEIEHIMTIQEEPEGNTEDSADNNKE
jgi:hypothetical protein